MILDMGKQYGEHAKILSEKVNAEMKKNFKVIHEITESLKKQIEDISPAILMVQESIRQFEESKEFHKFEQQAFNNSGWWITPSLMEVPVYKFRNAVIKYNKGQKIAITNLYISIYQKNNCKYLGQVLNSWDSNKYFKPWMKIIRQALEAHVDKKYFLSVPALLLVAEGISTNYCKKNKIKIPYKENSKGGEKIKKALNYIKNNKEIEFLNADFFILALDNIIYAQTYKINKKTFKYFLNRHAVLHGGTTDYGTLKNSLKCFMLLDFLSILK